MNLIRVGDRRGTVSTGSLLVWVLLQQSGRFNVPDRDKLDEIRQEAGFLKKGAAIRGASYVLRRVSSAAHQG
jgi:curli biogenesis system outer membrane secretion channel CsgG